MNRLEAGFSRLDITPMLGIGMCGYFQVRNAQGVLDPLEVNALALSCGEEKLLLISLDTGEVNTWTMDWLRQAVHEATGVPLPAVFISCTHTHTGPFTDCAGEDELIRKYTDWMRMKIMDAAVLALADLKEARLGIGTGKAENVAFIRRYVMKDGSIQTNPGVDNPLIDHPLGEVDERVHVLRFKRENADDIVLVNFGNHPDVVGGCLISADWPGFLRRRTEMALPGVKCVFFNGAQGDVNHVNVHPRGGDLNDMFMDFDDVSRGYGHARHIGNVMTAAVLTVFDKVEYRDVEQIRYLSRTIRVPSNMPRPEDMPEAKRVNSLHQAGRDDELPYRGMMLTTVVAEAERMIALENGPEEFEMTLYGAAIGDIVLIGIPGEPFTGIGRALKEAPGFAAVLVCCLTNGWEGYFPMMDAYEEGGYEARSSRYKAGVAERIIEEGLCLLKQLKML